MNRLLLTSTLLAAIGMAGCSTVVPRVPGTVAGVQPGSELFGRTIRVESGGRTSTMDLRNDGTVTARFGGNQLQGNWAVAGGKICFTWGTNRDCWPYTAPFRRGETVTLTSDRGNVVKVTLL